MAFEEEIVYKSCGCNQPHSEAFDKEDGMPQGVAMKTGSTKMMTAVEPGVLKMTFGQNLSAFDVGTCPHRFPDLDVLRCEFAERVLRELASVGIATHLIKKVSERELLVKEFQTYALQSDGTMELQPALSGQSYGRMIPLEFIARLKIANPKFLKRIESGEITKGQLGLGPEDEVYVGMVLPKIFVECSTKLESVDRYVTNGEAMRIAGIDCIDLKICKERTAYAARNMAEQSEPRGYTLWDIKVELAQDQLGQIVVADVITPDEMRLTDSEGRSYDKDPFRRFLEKVGFKAEVDKARATGTDLPEYPEIPSRVEREVVEGYRTVCAALWAPLRL